MKRNLLFAFLLAIFLLQGTVAALGIDASLFPQQSNGVVQVSAAQDDSENAVDVEIADGATVSSTIEELSDYAIPGQPNPTTLTRSTRSANSPLFFLSIVPLTAKPPPRA
jgi:hypothetical protein